MRQRPSWYHYIIPFLLKTLGVAVFGCYLSFYFLCVSKFDFKLALIVGISRPSLHVYIKNLPNSNIWLSVFQL